MTKGGLIIFDDYSAPSCLGAKDAVDAFFTDKPEDVVPLSQPAWGCVKGGGDARDVLAEFMGPLLRFRRTRSLAFAD